MTSLPATPPPKRLGLVIDLDICVGCHACVVSCKEWNTGGYPAPLSDLNPYGSGQTGAAQRPQPLRQRTDRRLAEPGAQLRGGR